MFAKTSLVVVVGLVASVVPALSPPALATGDERLSRTVLRDSARDVWGGSVDATEPTKIGGYPPADVRRAVADHRRHALVVRMRFANLRKVGEQTYVVDIRTPRSSFAAFVVSEAGDRRGSRLLDNGDGTGCSDFTHRIDYATDVLTMRIRRSCLGSPRWVKVSMANYLTIGGSLWAEDWDMLYADNPHSAQFTGGFTPRLYPS